MGALERIVAEIPLGKSVLLLGRYTYDDYLLAKNFRQRRSGNSLFYTICGREVEFLTMHRSKGLEADYVVLLNCNNGSFGFPSTIADDPVLGFVMSDSDGYLFGEERRLFYVAMTRAKVRTIVMYDKSKPSVLFWSAYRLNALRTSQLNRIQMPAIAGQGLTTENYINFIVAEWASVKSLRRWGAAKRR